MRTFFSICENETAIFTVVDDFPSCGIVLVTARVRGGLEAVLIKFTAAYTRRRVIPMDPWTVLAAIATAIAALFSGISAIIAATAIQQSIKIHQQQMLLAQRQLLLPLSDRLQELNDVNPNAPVWPDVIKAVNILELAAICWEGQLIDEDIIRRMFRRQYIEFYDKIRECRNPPENVERDGRQMLLECPAVGSLYKQLNDEYMAQGKLTPIE